MCPVDLAVRLFMSPGCNPVEIMENRLRVVRTHTSRAATNEIEDRLRVLLAHSSITATNSSMMIRRYVETLLLENVDPSVSSVFAGVNEPLIYEEWHRNLNLLKAKPRNSSTQALSEALAITGTLEWLLEALLSLKIGVDAVRIFAQENTAELLVAFYHPPQSQNPLLMLTRIMRAFQNRELIMSRPIRLALVKTWLPIIHKLVLGNAKKSTLENDLQEGMRALTKTLPQEDQSEIFKIWFATCFEVPSGVSSQMLSSSPRLQVPWPDLKEVFELSCDKLRQAHQMQEKGQSSYV